MARAASKIKVIEEDHLTPAEFATIDFGQLPDDRFVIISDVLEKLTGLKFLPEKKGHEILDRDKLMTRIVFAHRSTSTEDEFHEMR